MKSLMKKVREFARNEEGQGLVEYVLIIALVAIVVIAALTFLGTQVGTKINYVGNQLS